jgi:cellulase/cellobiase CelA1
LNVTVTNKGSTAVNGWKTTLNFSEPPQVTSSWNVTLSTSGNTVTATNCCSWQALQPGQSTSFGFQGNHDGSFNPPSCSASAN